VVFEAPGFEPGEIEVAVTPLEVGLHALSAHRLQDGRLYGENSLSTRRTEGSTFRYRSITIR
jgi:hypothetical protein